MSIFHLNQRIGKRSQGKNSVFASAYFRGEKRYCERTEETKDFSKKPDVVYKACILPDDAPSWAKKLLQAQVQTADGNYVYDVSGDVLSNDLWNKIEFAENRKDSQLYRHTDIALPNELSLDDAKKLVARYARDFLAKDGVFCDLAIHWDEGNHHVHLMQPFRQLTHEGFSAKKIRVSKAQLGEQVLVLRKGWADYCNAALKEAGFDIRIDHRSYKERGIDLIPTRKVGKATHMHGSEHQAIRLAENEAISQRNLEAIKRDPSIIGKKIAQQTTLVTTTDAEAAVDYYIVNEACLAQIEKEDNTAHTTDIDRADSRSDSVKPHVETPLSTHEKSPDSVKQDNHSHATVGSKVEGISATVLAETNPDNGDVIDSHLDASLEKRRLAIMADIQKTQGVFNAKTLKAKVLAQAHNTTEYQALVQRVLASQELISLGLGEDGREHYTTKVAFDLELDLAQTVQQLSRRVVKSTSPLQVSRLAHKMTLNPGQARALAHIHNDTAISIVVRYAGTGKTYLLKAANTLWAKKKQDVFGIALSGAAAASLQKESGIDSSTIASFLRQLKSGRIKLDNNSVVVMDEMGMTPLDDMQAVMAAVNRAGAEFVGLGDGEQTQPIGRTGAPMRAIIEQTGCITLDEVMRQHEPWQRRATVLMETQRTRLALDAYHARGCVQLVADHAVSKSVVDAWFNHVNVVRKKEIEWVSALQSSIMIAHQNDNVKILNDLARQALQQKGALRSTHHFSAAAGQLAIGLGERLLFKQNDRHLGVKNGHFGTLLAIDEQGKLTVKCDNGGVVSFSCHDYNAIDYGYAATVHKLQGFTGDHSVVHIDGHGWDRHLFLVAASRHRHSLSLLASDETFRDYAHLSESVSRRGLSDHVLEFPATFALRRGLKPESVVTRAVRAVRQASSSVYDAWLYLYNFQGFLDREAEKTVAANESPEKLQLKRRKDAVKVADFADNRVAIAQAISRLSSFSGDEKEQAQSNLYALQKRNGLLAVEILTHRDQHVTAIERNRLPESALDKALAFIDRDQSVEVAVSSYRLQQFSDGVLADKIMTEIKSYWGHLLHHVPDNDERNLFLAFARPLATQHQYDEAMKQLEMEEDKQCLNTVKRYCDLDTEASLQLRALKELSDDQKKVAQGALSAITYERDRLADQICSDEAAYRFRRDALHIDDERLHAHQQRCHDRDTIWTFASMPPSESRKLNHKRTLLAKRIKAEPKRYGSLVFEQLIDGYKSINIEAWHGECFRTVYMEGSFRLRSTVRNLRKYSVACRATSRAWQVAYHKRDKHSPYFERYMRYAQGQAELRDRFASEIVADFNRYALAVDQARIDLSKLNQHARQYDYMARYRHETNPMRRLRMAHHIRANMKRFGALAATYDLKQRLYVEAHHYHYLHALKKEPTAAIRRAIRWGEKYRAKRIDAGIAWGLTKSAKGKQHDARVLQAKQLTYQRNRAAYRFVQACYAKGIDSIDESGIKIDFDAVNKAARQHIAYKRILTYLNSDTQKQGALANQILADRSGFHFVYEKGIDFKLLNAQSRAWSAGQSIPSVVPTQTTPKTGVQQCSRWDIDRINTALMANPEQTYQAIIGDYKKRGNELRFGDGLCVTATGAKAGLWYSFTESVGGTPIHALQHFHGKPLPDALEYGASLAGLSDAEAKTDQVTIRTRPAVQTKDENTALRIKAAQSLWQKTQVVELDDPVDRYMSEHRNIYTTAGLDLRLLPVGATWVDYGDDGNSIEKVNKLPLMVVAAKDVAGNVTGVQRTFLDKKTHNKASFMDNPKLSKGIIKGSAVTLQTGTNGKIYIAEGVETGASLALADRSATILVSLSVANMNALLPLVQAHNPDHVIIAQDNDGDNAMSEKTITDVLKHYQNSALSISAIKPNMLPGKTKTDWNDVLQAKGVNAIRHEIGIPIPEYKLNPQKILDEAFKPDLPDTSSIDDIAYKAIKDYVKFRRTAGLFLVDNEGVKDETTKRLRYFHFYNVRAQAHHMRLDDITMTWVKKLGLADSVARDARRFKHSDLTHAVDDKEARDQYHRMKLHTSMAYVRADRGVIDTDAKLAAYNKALSVKKGKGRKY